MLGCLCGIGSHWNGFTAAPVRSRRGQECWAYSPSTETEIELLITRQQRTALETRAFDSTSIIDARERVLAQIVRRRGQQEFREKLLAAYGGCCAITGCDAVAALEAAHIIPYLGPETNFVENGILLRADIHTLFDLGLIAVDPKTIKVVISGDLGTTAYGDIAGVQLREPASKGFRPSLDALRRHWEWARLR